MTTPQLAITDGFLRATLALTSAQSRAVEEALSKLRSGYKAVHLHALQSLPFKSFTVNQGALRVICLQEGGTLILLHVDTHDEAYAWARRHRVVQVGHTVRIVPLELERAAEVAPASEAKGPLADVPDKVFRHFGLGPHACEALRRVPSEEALFDLAQHLEPALGTALVGLGLEPDRLAELVREYEAAKAQPVEAPALEETLLDPSNSATFHLLPPGEKPLERALAGSFEAWRVFLHPTQRRIVERNAKGAVRVTGGPGTGKTVVAIHRARFLAEHLLAGDERPVLLTTFSRALTDALEPMLKTLLADRPDLAPRIVTRTLTSVVQDVLRAAGRPAELLGDETIEHCWDDAMSEEALDLAPPFYPSEREHVLARHDVWTEAAYLRVERTERHRRLDRGARRKVWRVLEAFERAMEARGGGDLAALAREATAVLRAGAAQPYAAVVCDEAQDVGPPELRFLAALAGAGGRIRPNALFLAGDGHQRIYKSAVPLTACGIDIRGSSTCLKLNYRTTEGIRAASVQVVEGHGIDAFEEGDAEQSTLAGYRSLRAGPAPETRTFATREEEAAWIAAALRDRADDFTLILARTNALLDALGERLRAHGLEPARAGREAVIPSRGIVLCTLHRAKGLEAPQVIIAAADKIPARYAGGADEADRAIWKRREESLLYVAMSRARDRCTITRIGT